ncbi:MAG TPA: ROK family protein [Actinomycetales bacterium]|nr:ROK family protein [Actinomycetales bacterium]
MATEQLRRQNTALVLRQLRSAGPASRAGLAQATGLAKATVGAIVADLHRQGVVRDAPVVDVTDAEPRLGRPGRPVELDGAHLVALGLEVNVDYVAATALDLAGRRVLQQRQPLAAEQSPLEEVTDLAARSLVELGRQRRDVLGVAVAVPGLVDHENGHVVTAPNLGWRDLPLAQLLAASLPAGALPTGRPLRVDNDANDAAVAEAAWGAARGRSPVLYLTGTVGLGAGVVVDGAAQRGASGFAGEVGHVPIGGSSLRCACGRVGCWETVVGLPATLRAVGMLAEGHEPGTVTGDPVQVAAAVAARAERDPTVAARLGDVARGLASGIVTLVSMLDPEMVVLGGYFVPLGPWLLPVVEQAVRDDVLAGSTRRCTVALSTLGLHAASSGAAADVLSGVFTGSLPVTP